MPVRRVSTRIRLTSMLGGAAVLVGSVTGSVVLAPAAAARSAEVPPGPDYELPFPCGEQWTGSTRPDHRPTPDAVDFNRPGDLGALTLVTAPGVVSKVGNTGSSSYGRWVMIDHGGGFSSVYAHLKAQWVVPGQRVDQGTVLGRVGDTGAVSGAHLHFEQRYGSTVQRPVFHQAEFVQGSTSASLNCPDVPVAVDRDRDGRDDVAVYRREPAGGSFELLGEAGPVAVPFGRSTDIPVVGDWDGDGVTDLGVRRHQGRKFLLLAADGSQGKLRFGRPGDRPVVGDWDGDGRSEVGVWRPRKTQFRLRLPDGKQVKVRLGAVGSDPVTGDWDGDGVTDLGVFDAPTATFTLRTVDPTGAVTLRIVPLGSATDLPVTGDWDGDGRTDLGTWSPSTAVFTLRTEPAPTTATARSRARVSTVTFGRPRH